MGNANGTVGVHLCIIRRVNIIICKKKKKGISHIVKLLKLDCFFTIGAVPIHDVATREKRLLGSELAVFFT